MRLSIRPRRSLAQLYQEYPHWLLTAGLDEEMKRRLDIGDKRKAETNQQGVTYGN